MCALVTGVQTCALPIFRRPPHRHRAPTPRVALPAGKRARPGSPATCLGDADRRSAQLRKAESQPRTDLVDRREILRPALGEIEDRKSVVWGKSVSVRVDLGGRGIITKNTKTTKS